MLTLYSHFSLLTTTKEFQVLSYLSICISSILSPGPGHMEGTFINFALEGSSAASTVRRKARRETTRDSFVPWNQPPIRLGPLLRQKSTPKPQNSIRSYPTPETPSNNVEMNDENEMDDAGSWYNPHNMYAGQRIFGDVSKL
jgi:hypothetical protein